MVQCAEKDARACVLAQPNPVRAGSIEVGSAVVVDQCTLQVVKKHVLADGIGLVLRYTVPWDEQSAEERFSLRYNANDVLPVVLTPREAFACQAPQRCVVAARRPRSKPRRRKSR